MSKTLINPPSRANAARRPGPKGGGGNLVTLEQSAIMAQREIAADDIDVKRMVLDIAGSRRKGDIDITEVLLDGTIERTIEVASTITIDLNDPDMDLLDSGVLDTAIDVQVDGFWFRLTNFDWEGGVLTLTFEPRDVSYLRHKSKVMHASRSDMTRAEFCYALVREVKAHQIQVVCPELHKTQPIKADKHRQQTTREIRRQRGFGPGVDIKIKGKRATKKQLDNMDRVLGVGADMNASYKLLVCSMMTIIQESLAYTTNTSAGHTGLFNQDLRHGSVWQQEGGATGVPELDAKAFFTVAKKIDSDDPKQPYATLCENVQHSGLNPSATYGRWKDEAANIVDTWGGSPKGDERVYFGRTIFSTKDDQGKHQNYWDAMHRLMDEVNWRVFYTNGLLYIISEEDLMRSKKRMVVTRTMPGMIGDWSVRYSPKKKESSITFSCLADRWIAPPGSVVQVKGVGAASGNWLVSTIRRTIYNPETEITLKKPDHSFKEPQSEIKTQSFDDISVTKGGKLKIRNSKLVDVYHAMQRIDQKHYPYAWGGGHPFCGKPSRSVRPGETQIGYDCSGSVAAVLAAADLGFHRGDQVPGSGWMAENWGNYGEGTDLTMWANSVHVFLEIKVGNKWIHFGTGDWGKGWTGPGFNQNLHPHAGFTPRHWPGLAPDLAPSYNPAPQINRRDF